MPACHRSEIPDGGRGRQPALGGVEVDRSGAQVRLEPQPGRQPAPKARGGIIWSYHRTVGTFIGVRPRAFRNPSWAGTAATTARIERGLEVTRASLPRARGFWPGS